MTCRLLIHTAIVVLMIVLFTDFGGGGPYLGQMHAVLTRHAPEVPVIELFTDAPAFDARASAYLLAAYASEFAKGDVFVCVVDPGVGGPRTRRRNAGADHRQRDLYRSRLRLDI